MMKTITRGALYNKIWSITKTKTAVELDLTPTHLDELCKEHNIPTPTSNYWVQLKLGRKAIKSELPDAENDYAIDLNPQIKTKTKKTEIISRGNKYSDILDMHLAQQEQEKERAKTLCAAHSGKFIVNFTSSPDSWMENIVTVVNLFPVRDVVKSHRDIILQTKAYLKILRLPWDEREKHPDYRRSKVHLDISVSKESEDRALRLFEAVINILEALGGRMIFNECTTHVMFSDVKISLRLTEKNRRVLNTDSNNSWDRYTYQPSGALRLSIGDRYRPQNVEDTSATKIEEKLDSVVKKCFQEVSYEFEQRELRCKREIEQKRIEEERRRELERQQELERLKESERKKVRCTFDILRREMIIKLIDSIIEKYSQSRSNEIHILLDSMRRVIDPLNSDNADTCLSQVEIDKLVNEFFGSINNLDQQPRNNYFMR